MMVLKPSYKTALFRAQIKLVRGQSISLTPPQFELYDILMFYSRSTVVTLNIL